MSVSSKLLKLAQELQSAVQETSPKITAGEIASFIEGSDFTKADLNLIARAFRIKFEELEAKEKAQADEDTKQKYGLVD